MASRSLDTVLHQIRRIAGRGEVAGSEDRQLLDRFVHGADERAFEALVRRYGPMVLGICRRMLRDPHDSEDAFQATFLVLVRKASSLGRRDLLANWLYGVAVRSALKARTARARRRARETPVADFPGPVDDDRDPGWADLRPVLDEELSRLPDRYRLPVLLCWVQEKTLCQAAQELSWPEGTVAGRLARARRLLRKRLTRRGVTLASGFLVSGSVSDLSAAMSPELVQAAVRSAVLVGASFTTAASAVSVSVAALTEGVTQAMFLSKVKYAATVLLSIGLLGAGVGAGVGAFPKPGANSPDPGVADVPKPAEPKADEARKEVADPPAPGPDDQVPKLRVLDDKQAKILVNKSKHSDRMKSLLLARFDAAKTEVDRRWKEFFAGRGTLAILFTASLHLLEAERELSDQKAMDLRALENHLSRMQESEKVNQRRFDEGRIPIQDVAQSKVYRLQAEIWLERAKAKGEAVK